MKVLALLATGFEDLEALGTIALLRRAAISVDICSVENKKQIIGKYHIKVEADVLIDQIHSPDYDVLFLPGGMPGVENLYQVEKVQKLVEYFMKSNKVTACICAAASIPGRMGLLEDRMYTCYPGFEKQVINGQYQNTSVFVDGNLITGKAAGSVHEFAEAIIRHLKGKSTSEEVMKNIYYEK